jgi:hypothetical protein
MLFYAARPSPANDLQSAARGFEFISQIRGLRRCFRSRFPYDFLEIVAVALFAVFDNFVVDFLQALLRETFAPVLEVDERVGRFLDGGYKIHVDQNRGAFF